MPADLCRAIYDGRLDDARAEVDYVLEDASAAPFEGLWILPMWVSQLTAVPGLLPWLGRAIVEKASNRFIGTIGFHGPPGAHIYEEDDPGVVEFGYYVEADYRGRGYAAEASIGLVDWAYENHGVKNYRLTVPLDNPASARVAEKAGFKLLGEFDHPRVGQSWYYGLVRG